MKIGNIINVILQSLGLLGTIAALLLAYLDARGGDYGLFRFRQDAIIIVIVGEVGLTFYQVIHAFVISILKLVRKEFNWLFGIYWIMGLTYIIGWIVFFAISNTRSVGDNEIVTIVLIGWIPILYYLGISIVDLVKRYKK